MLHISYPQRLTRTYRTHRLYYGSRRVNLQTVRISGFSTLLTVISIGLSVRFTDFHPVHTIYGWKTTFKRAGVTYHLPTVAYTRDAYLEAVTASGLTILEVAESLVGEVPEGYLPEEMRRTYADTPFCLSILAHK